MTLHEHVMKLRADRVDGRPYVQGIRAPALPALTGEARVSALLSIALELKELEAVLVREAVEAMRAIVREAADPTRDATEQP